ncbi:MAG: sigma-70 family RNA polymerase sigma factor [Planctomycetes bacterium]|nr:sigma-70 family RNA polymerase sigma factor [Planctomycetota bacterium]
MSDENVPLAEEFCDLVEMHHVSLRVFLRSSGARPESVDDIAQEALLVAYRKWDQFDQSRDFGKWVRGIGFKILVNERRKIARRKRIYAEELCDILKEKANECFLKDKEAEIWQDKADLLPDCLSRLPEKSRDLLKRRYELGEKAPLISKALGKKTDAIRKNLSRIRVLLRDCINAKLESAT